MQRAFLSSVGLLLAPLSCAVQSNELFQQEDALATATQPVYYGDGRPGTAVSDTCGRHSAVGRVKRSDQSWCSAVLVRNNIALSAQHCGIVANKATLSFPGTRNPDDFKVIKVTSAPDWHGNVNKPDPEDISVLQLEKAVPRHVAQPLWLLMDPPQSTRNGLTLAEYDNPVMDPEPELCGYGGTRKSDSGDGAGTRRYVPAISLEWSSDYCDKVIGEGPCWTYPYWRNGSELDSPDLNYFASGDSGGALIGYVKGLWHRSYYSTTIRAEAVVPALLGILSGNFQSDFVVEKDNGQMIAATFNNSAAVRNMLAQEVYGVPEAPYESIPGPSLAQLALYGAEWGLQIDDRASVYGLNGGYGDVASNPLGWLGCTATPTSATPDVIDEKYFTILGPDSHVGNVWANDNLSFHDRANVHGTAYAEGDIKVTTQAVVTNVQPHQRVDLPSLNVTDVNIPSGTRCSNIALEPDRIQTVPTNCAYIPSVMVKSRSTLSFPCASTPYHIGSLSTEPEAALVFSTSQCQNATVYVHNSLSLKGSMQSGIDPAAATYSNVLFVVTSTGKVDIQSGFNGVLLAPNGFVHLVPGQKHYGAIYGKHVFLEQDSKLYFRPFNGVLPVQ